MDDSARTSLVGRTLAHYRINTTIGAGGMGEVYRATDTKLARDIALKVLPAEMASDPDRLSRFQREARAVAALNHPNVVTVYSVEESGNVHFITMELIEGQPLDRLISANGLPADRIVEIAGAIAEALAAAHEKGIVHRDLKPANVMVTNEGRVKVLDFGLSKDLGAEAASDATLTSAGRTQAGMVMGTPAYMSPEQVAGRSLDHRSDIFSFGVVLHEMATGRRPFEGSSSAELISSILRDTPPSVTDVRPELPSDLARVIRRCLEKDPRHRLQTARDVSNEFRDLARTATRPAPVSTSTSRATITAESGTARAAVREDEGFWVAVLPFKCSGTNADLIALAEGLSEELITGLSRFSYLRVIARSSTARYAGQSVDVRSAGNELNARYVMEGTLRQAVSKLRLAVQLIDTNSGAHLWAENYERSFSSEAVFELQDDLVPRIVSTVADMNGVLPRSMSEGLRSRSPEQLSPYEAVLRSFAYTYSATPEELAAARSALEAAVHKAPGYPDAWAMLSFLCGQDYVHGYELQANALEIAVSAARRAVAVGPSNHLSYFSLGQALWCQKDYDSFRDAAERAVVLNPMDGNSVAYLGELLTYAGCEERGMQLVERAKQLNPNHPGWYWFADFYHAFSQGDYRGAHAFGLKAKLHGNPLAPMFIAAACGQLGDIEGGAKAVADLLKFRPELPALMPKQVAKVWNHEYGERFLEGLRKAGVEIPEAGAAVRREASSTPTGARDLAARGKIDSGAARAEEGFWVAVLPFRHVGNNADLAALAEGLTDDVVTNMSKFSYLRVVARSSTAQYAQRAVDVRTAAKEVGARYVMEGSIRQAGAKVRIAVQLVDASAGASLWAETYDRPFAPNAMLDLLDDVVPRLVATVGDAQGILAHSMTEALRNRDPESLTPYEALLRSFGFHQHVSAEEHAAAVTALERAVKRAPDRADCWATLSWLYRAEYTHGYNARPDSMNRSLEAARRAVNLAPSNQLPHAALASAHFFRHELGSFRAAAERALSLNRMEGYTTAFLGLHFAYSGDWERGCALCQAATQLNPNHPGWYWLPLAINAYRQHDGERALEYALKVNMPGLWTAQVALAGIYSQLGHMEPARIAVRDLLALRPDFATKARAELGIWWQPDMVEQMLGDLREAGLEDDFTAAPTHSAGIAPVSTASGQTRADEGFWVAVLPFKYVGKNDDLKALAEGLSEEIITGLSRFSYLRVIARGSTVKYSSESGDVRTIGKELGARYIMEGSLRHAGSKMRLAVQLADTVSGAHLWAETFERAFTHESVFEVQDDLVPRIVSTVADMYGLLPRTMSEALRNKSEDALTPHEAVLRAFSYFARLTPEEHATVRRILERVVRETPDQADCWAMLAMMYIIEYSDGYNVLPNPLERALAAAQHAVDLAPSHTLGHYALAWVYFFRKDKASLHAAVERAVALNPMDGSVIGLLGLLMHHAGELERGCQMVEKAMQLNPNYPGVLRFTPFTHAYCQGKYTEALEAAVRINMPGFFYAHAALAAAHGQLGQCEAARKAVQEVLALRPDFATVARREYAKWFNPEDIEHLVDGLRKAGLEIAGEAAKPAATKSTTIATVSSSGATRADEGFWVAVLPFRSAGSNAELKALAEGLSEEIITGLSRFSYLRVIARGSTAKYSSESGDVRAIGKELGARYVIEGSLRQMGTTLRTAVQVVDATTGAHLWAHTYERTVRAEDVFASQDDITDHVVATVADANGVLARSIAAGVEEKPDVALTALDWMLRGFSYRRNVSPDRHAKLREGLEKFVEREPKHADVWACLALVYLDEFSFGFNVRPDALGRALAAAHQSVKIDRSCQNGNQILAQVHFFRRDVPAFRASAEEAIALNPRNTETLASMAMFFVFIREFERGADLARRAMDLNPHHAGWYHVPLLWDHFQKGEYQQALDQETRINIPGLFWQPLAVAACCGLLGRKAEAAAAAEELRRLDKDIELHLRHRIETYNYASGFTDRILEGLEKAGLKIPPADASS